METKQTRGPETTYTQPRWVPKPPPPPGPWDRFRILLRRSIFPLAVLLFLGGVLLFLLGLPDLSVPSLFERPASEEQPTAAPDELEPATPGGEPIPLSIDSEPSGATVLIDGDSVGTTPLRDVPLAGGAYILSLRMDDYRMPDTLVVLRSGAPSSFAFRLRGLVAEDTEAMPSPPPEEEAVAEASPPQQTETEPSVQEETPTQEEPPVQEETPPAEQPDPQPVEQEEDLDEELSEEDFAMGDIIVTSDPSGAAVLLNGIRRGSTPIILSDLQIGSKEIRIQMDGHETYVEEVDLEAAEEHIIFTSLSPLSGQLRVLVRPWGSIYINGSLHESETNVRYTTDLPVGTHTIRVEHPTLGTQEREVAIREGEVSSIVLDLNE